MIGRWLENGAPAGHLEAKLGIGTHAQDASPAVRLERGLDGGSEMVGRDSPREAAGDLVLDPQASRIERPGATVDGSPRESPVAVVAARHPHALACVLDAETGELILALRKRRFGKMQIERLKQELAAFRDGHGRTAFA